MSTAVLEFAKAVYAMRNLSATDTVAAPEVRARETGHTTKDEHLLAYPHLFERLTQVCELPL